MADPATQTTAPAPEPAPPVVGNGPTHPDPNALFNPDPNALWGDIQQPVPPTSLTPAQVSDKATVASMAILKTGATTHEQAQDYMANHSQIYNHVDAEGDDAIRESAEKVEASAALSAYASAASNAQLANDQKQAGFWTSLSQATLKQSQELTQKSALEKMAVGKMLDAQAQGDPYQAWVIARNLQGGNADQTIVENNATLMALHRAVQDSEVTAENQSWFEHLGGFLMGLIPYRDSLNTVDLANSIQKGTASWLDALYTGRAVQATTQNLWSMPYKQRVEFINTKLVPMVYAHTGLLGLHEKGEALAGLSEIVQNGDTFHYGLNSAINSVSLIPFFEGGAKFALSPVRLAMRLGGPKMAVDAAAQTAALVKAGGEDIARKTIGMGTEDVVDAATPSALNPAKAGEPITANTPGNVLAHSAATAINNGMALVDAGQTTTRVLSNAEQQAITNSWKELTEKTAMGSHIQDTQVVPRNVGTSRVMEAQMTLGQVNSAEGWLTEDAARNAATQLHIEADPFEAENGQWYLKHSQIIPENLAEASLPQIKPNATNWFSRMFSGARVISDLGIANQGAQGQDVVNRLQKFFRDRYQKVFSTLNTDQAGSLNSALRGMNAEKFWMSDRGLEEFYERAFKRAPSQKEMDAYHAFIEHNDVKYYLENSLMYKKAALAGEEGLTLHTGAGTDVTQANAKIDRELSLTLDDLNSEPVWDSVTGTLRNGGYTEDELAALRDKRVALATLRDPADVPGSRDTFRRVLVKAGDPDTFIHELNPIQVPYIGGGNRMYADGLYYLKQTSKNAWGILENPNVLGAGTKAQVASMADRLNGALDIYKGKQENLKEAIKAGEKAYAGRLKGAAKTGRMAKWQTSPERNAIIDQVHMDTKTALDAHFDGDPRWDGQSFMDMVDSKQVHPDFQFGTYYDKEMPAEYSTATKSWASTDENGADQMRRSTGRLFFGRKGEQLLDWQGKLAPTLNPLDMMDRTTRAISQMVGMDDFRESAIQRWLGTFKGNLNFDQSWSPYQIFQRATVSPDTSEFLKQKLLAQRDVIQRLLSYSSPDIDSLNSYQRGMRDWVQGMDPANKFRQSIDWNVDANPVQALKNFAFDTRIGLWDISRFPLHASISSSALALDPVNGLRGYMNWPALRYFLGVKPENEEAALNTLIGRGVHTMAGMDAAEYKAYMQYVKESGFAHVGGSSDLKSSNAMSIMNHYSQIKNSATFFFDEAELLNRLTASRMAWEDAKNGAIRRSGILEGKKINFKPGMENTPEFNQLFAGRIRDYSFNMDRASTAAWQRGIASIPTQFWAYASRQMEALVGNRFTTAQKARLVLAHTMLFGSAGTLPLSVASTAYQAATGQVPGATWDHPERNALDTPIGFADRGLIDESIYHMTGTDVTMGQRYGTGDFFPELVREAFGVSSYGEKSLADLGGGASFSNAGAALSNLWDVLKYATAESGDRSMPLTAFAANKLMSTSAVYSHAMKAYMIYKYGQLRSIKGSVVADDIPPQNAVAMALLGVQPGSVRHISGMESYMKNKDQQVKDLRDHFLSIREKFAHDPDNADDYLSEVNTLSRLNDPDVVRKASQQASRMMPGSIESAITRRYQQQKQLEQTEDNVQEDNQ